MPDRPEVSKEFIAPKFLDEALLITPVLAMEAARFEGHRMAQIASAMVVQIGPALRNRDAGQLDELEKMDDQIDVLKETIMAYMGEIYKQELTTDEGRYLLRMMRGTDEIQRISTVVRNDPVGVARVLIDSDMATSDTTGHVLTTLYNQVRAAVNLAVDAINDNDEGKAHEIIQMRSTVHGLIDDALDYQQERFSSSDGQLVALFRLEDDVIDSLKRIYSLSKRVANLLLPATVAARDV